MVVPLTLQKTIQLLKLYDPNLIVEVLTPDFQGNTDQIEKVVRAKPDVFAHKRGNCGKTDADGSRPESRLPTKVWMF